MNARPKNCIFTFVIQKNNADFCCLYFDLLDHLGTEQILHRLPFYIKRLQWFLLFSD